MSLTIGSRLGHYDVTALIGEGGMGQVYRATDTQLGRDVALKILPDAFAADPDRLARFQREAQVLASLNHPGIAAIYGIEKSDDTQALVLELVEGPTLADRIAKGPIPLDEALPIAKQIAEALEAAHEAGVIHRDLKPANIKVREDGTVKVLDFGLAKALDTMPAGDPSQSPTLTAAATQMGVILGTAAYMSPEQARGKPVDKRADIWGFGCVLFEMLTGRRVFQGEDVSTTLANVIRADVSWESLPRDLAPGLATYLRRCLDKDPTRRVRDMGDVRLAMDGAFDTPAAMSPAPAAVPQLQLWQRPIPAVVGGLALLVVGGSAIWATISNRAPLPTQPVARFEIPFRPDESLTGTGRHAVSLSADGQQLVYTTSNGLSLRSLGEVTPTLLRGTDGLAREPFFSPDGRTVGFYADGQLYKVSISGGAPVALCDAGSPFGASWASDDTILYGQGPGGILGGHPKAAINGHLKTGHFDSGPRR